LSEARGTKDEDQEREAVSRPIDAINGIEGAVMVSEVINRFHLFTACQSLNLFWLLCRLFLRLPEAGLGASTVSAPLSVAFSVMELPEKEKYSSRGMSLGSLVIAGSNLDEDMPSSTFDSYSDIFEEMVSASRNNSKLLASTKHMHIIVDMLLESSGS
jgi:hypothetical protein